MNWPKIIKAIRERVFATQTELAEMINVSFASVNRWEQGHHEPTMKAKRKLPRFAGKTTSIWRPYKRIRLSNGPAERLIFWISLCH